MKKFFIFLSLFIALLFVPFINFPGSGAFAKISLMNFTPVKVYESFIKHELKDELGADFDVKLEIYSSEKLKNGIFKSLKLSSKRLFYKGLSLSDVQAETINENNKFIYKKKRVYYPEELPLKFIASITNEDINAALSSEMFNTRLDELNDKTGGIFYIERPDIAIKSGKIYFDVPLKTMFLSKRFYLHFNSDIEVENNEIMLKNITFTSSGNIIDMSILDAIAAQLNPIKIKKEALQNKFCNILIETAKINNDIINIDGNLVIKANYRGKNE